MIGKISIKASKTKITVISNIPGPYVPLVGNTWLPITKNKDSANSTLKTIILVLEKL
jgi:hypothetical protein